MTAPAPLECLVLGARSLKSRPRLILAGWIEMILVTGLTVAGGALPLAVVGFDRVRAVATDPDELQRLLFWMAEEAHWSDFVPGTPEMIAAWVGLLVAWTVALFVWCWFEAGIYGALLAGAEGGSQPSEDFRRRAREAFWRVFGLLHLFVLYLLIVQALWTWIVWLAVLGWEAWGGGALFAIGCGGTLPLALAAVVLGLWFSLARVEVVRPGTTVGAARKASWGLLRRRFGAVLGLGVLLTLIGAVAGGLLTPFSLLVDTGLTGGPWWLVRGFLEIVQAGLWGLVGVYTGAVWVSLVAGTTKGEDVTEPVGAVTASEGVV